MTKIKWEVMSDEKKKKTNSPLIIKLSVDYSFTFFKI